MKTQFCKIISALPLLLAFVSAQQPAPDANRPKVRAITAFVKIDREHATAQLTDAARMLQTAQKQFEKDGWTVQTIRVATQPFPEYVKGLPPDKALAFLLELDTFAEKVGFRLAIGPAMS